MTARKTRSVESTRRAEIRAQEFRHLEREFLKVAAAYNGSPGKREDKLKELAQVYGVSRNARKASHTNLMKAKAEGRVVGGPTQPGELSAEEWWSIYTGLAEQVDSVTIEMLAEAAERTIGAAHGAIEQFKIRGWLT